ncbi:hypothetical protein I6N95_17425 [Vagococcus sp. BWB3-3]|uniref:Uncharacterized protein n=1 Tax=Vagococcus allomyrinae TaxID=2794353 RepID=A0A940PFW3_9ENTE|nr:hypothetical protein [Vagococcus allomyrinae]MBP1042801.1 hypothetical protein [Vagococcus allomyrinae]
MAGGKVKEESGYALLYALGAIILASLIVGAIFLFAMRANSQIDRVDKLKQSKDVAEYALQKGSKEIKETLEKELAVAITTVDLKKDETKLRDLVKDWLPKVEQKKTKIGDNEQFSYELQYEASQLTAAMDKPYQLGKSDGAFGWTQEASLDPNGERINVQLTFPLTVKVTETNYDKTFTSTVKSDFIYEVQWETIDVNTDILAMDVWRNVFYSYYLPNSGQHVSADQWLKKVNQLYTFQEGFTKPFDYGSYTNTSNPLYGEFQSQITDVTDGSALDFTTGNKKIAQLRFAGSFLVEHGARMKGSTSSLLQAGNLLALRNQSTDASGDNYLQVATVKAVNGTFIELNHASSQLLLDVVDFQTSNLLINQTNAPKNKLNTQGVILAKGQLDIKNVAESNSFSFNQYAVSPISQDPKKTNWQEFVNGSLVLASSNLYAGDINKNGINSSVTDSRKINVDGNFMLTNVGMTTSSTAPEFDYFNGNQPQAPSHLTLVGENTELSAKGISFIDSVKTSRRKTYTESPAPNPDSREFSQFYNDEDYWNQIVLKEGASMTLGYTGVEPFHLEVAKKSHLSLKVLPELLLFDDAFLEEAVSNGRLKGKVILEPFNKEDATKLKERLARKGVTVTTTDKLETALGNTVDEGQVIIIEPVNTANKGDRRMLSRTFDYLKSIDY